ncbi:type IV pilin N-terminal domain-containing protein [Methanofollis formosanus]|uniref:type IV pilin N-terminal domain-containing protein n=1 Tax=Methanofollis formosanus TaxID=299308 RepID=UPI001C7D027C|nr:type IV pilin N-terminal domain-containing protein [Methanofollis formosanus]
MVDRDAAVSPVVGVMLMLVVTVIIAAVVSSFAGGLANDEAKAPDAQIKFVGPVLTSGFQGLEFEHAGGDPIDLRDLQIQLRCGNTQCEFGYFDEFARDHGRYVGHLDDSVKDRFQKVGVTGHDFYENYCTLRPGEKFRVYADTNRGFGMMGYSVYREGQSYSSIGLEWGMGNSFTLTDRKSGQVLASSVFGAPHENP